MHRFLFIFVLVSIFVSRFAIAQESAPADSRTASLQFTRLVEHEVRKQDPWILTAVQGDYTKPRAPGAVTLMRFDPAVLERMKKVGLLGFHAAYDPETNMLLLPVADPEVIDSLDHEFWHAFYDNVGERGFYFHAGVTAPTREEIARYAHAKVASPAFDALVERITLVKQTFEIESTAQKILRLAGKMIPIQGIFDEIASTQNTQKDLEAFIAPELLESFRARCKVFADRFGAVYKAVVVVHGTTKHLEQQVRQKEERGQKFTTDELVILKKAFEVALRDLAPLNSFLKDARAFRREVRDAYVAASSRKCEETIKNLETSLRKRIEVAKQEKNLARQAALEKELADIPSLRAATRSSDLKEVQNLFDTIERTSDVLEGVGIEELSDLLVWTANDNAVRSVLGEPDEVMARVIDSLYSIYFGEVSQNKFPLSEDDLRFLEQFRFGNAPIFRKGIERYRVACALVASGTDSRAVKDRLEYATEFVHEGKTYLWPETNFVIRGELPLKTIPKQDPAEEDSESRAATRPVK